MKGFQTDKEGSITAYLVDSDDTASSLIKIADATLTRADWDTTDSGTWIEDTIDFGDVNYTLAGGRYLGVKITVDGSSGDDMWFAYDATPYPSYLDYNVAPLAGDDAYSVNEDSVLNVAAAGVLANDTDADGDGLSAVLVGGPASGSLTLNADGSFSYTPNAGFNGSDSFTYQASDGAADSNTATVTITVNSAPAAGDDAYSVNEDTPLNVAAAGVLANDGDADGDPLSAVLVGGPASGSLTLNADGSFSYTPNADFNGSDSFTYKASDGAADSNTATVTITVNPVNDAPLAGDDAYSVDEDGVLNVAAAGVLTNDTDADGDGLSAVLVAGPGNGALTLNADGSFTYTPDADFNGSDSFTYKANDGTADSNTATVTIAVNPVNDAPVATNDSYTTDEDTALTVAAAAGVLANDGDVDGDPLTAVLVAGPSNGALTLNADGSFTYTPDADFNGSDSFTYRANDGTADSNTATVTIAVNPVNDAPVATNDSYTTDEDTPLTVAAAAGVLANDGDVDGDPLTAVLVAGPSNGALTLNADGSFTYTPDADFNGSDSFTYKAHDGTLDSNTATVAITVNSVNDAPVATNDSYTTDEDTALTVAAAAGVLANDTDADGDPLSAVLVTGPANGALTLNADGSFSYTPDADFNGSDSFTYKANDGTADSNTATVTITVDPVNDAPLAGDDADSVDEDTPLYVAAAGVLAGDDADSVDEDTPPKVAAAGVPANHHPLFAIRDLDLPTGPRRGGGISGRPTAGRAFAARENEPDPVVYVSHQGEETPEQHDSQADGRERLGKVNRNDAPVATTDAYRVNVNAMLNVRGGGVLGNDSGGRGGPLSAVLVDGPASGRLTLNADGSFSYTPDADFNGSDSFTYKASDGTADSNTATVTITVNPVDGRNTETRSADDAEKRGRKDSAVSGAGEAVPKRTARDGDAHRGSSGDRVTRLAPEGSNPLMDLKPVRQVHGHNLDGDSLLERLDEVFASESDREYLLVGGAVAAMTAMPGRRGQMGRRSFPRSARP